jgi:hypothetical protein
LSSGGWEVQGEPENLVWEDLISQIEHETIICGEVGEIGRSALEDIDLVKFTLPALSVRRPGILAELGWERLRLGDIDDPATLVPTYLQTRSSGEA